jgi:hypothetical protein
MLIQPAKNVEPIPGYQLIERLGSGGYGEVWKTTAPGGLTKAIKIVYGDMTSHRAEQEFKALGRIKEVRHPFLLSLERVEVIDGQLLIVTELGDRSLLDRFDECRKAGQWGIPRDELLIYLRDAAEALDYMAETHGLQHLDIKPQNLLLVGGRIKVADFGLVKDLVGTSVTATGGATPLYASPEAFDGRVSRFSDQYSLALVYQEMLTGVRPFPGTTALQLAAQHTTGRPLLDPLPPPDRPVIGRALAKIPEHRFPTCRALVDALFRGPPSPSPASPLIPRSSPTSESPPPLAAPSSVDLAALQLATETNVPAGRGLATPAQLSRQAPSEPADHGQPFTALAGKTGLRPTLFVGIGGLACTAVRQLRHRLQQRFGNLSRLPILRFLVVDTDRTALAAARQGDPALALSLDETLLTPLHPPEYYRPQSKTLLQWLDRRWLYGIPRSLQTEGLRPLGRLALVENAATVLPRLRDCLAQITRPEVLKAAVTASGGELRAQTPRVFVIASIAGGTGGAMLLATAYALRQLLAELHLPDDGLCGMLLHATSPKPAAKEMARINASATLQELAHFYDSDNAYPGDPAYDLAGFDRGQTPLPQCYLIHLGDDLNRPQADAATDAVAEYLYLDTATEAGPFFDQCRQASPPSPQDFSDGQLTLRTFGLSRISFPRYRLLEHATNLLCRHLVECWPGALTDTEKEGIEQDAQQLLARKGVGLDTLVHQLLAEANKVLGEEPDTYFPKLLAAEFSPEQIPPSASAASPGLATRILGKLDKVLGMGRAAYQGPPQHPTPLESGLEQWAGELGARLARTLVTWLMELVEDPRKRLQAADHVARYFAQHLLATSEAARSQFKELGLQRERLRRQLTLDEPGGREGGIRKLGLGWQSRPSATPERKFLEYCWQRLGELAVENALAVIGRVYQEISSFSQDSVLCRLRLNQFATLFTPAGRRLDGSGNRPAPIPNLTEVLPGQVDDLATAADAVLKSLPPETIRQVFEAFQAEVVKPRGGLWGILLGKESAAQEAASRAPASLAFWDLISQDSELARGLKEELQSRARSAIRDGLREYNAATLFLEAHGDPELARNALVIRVQEARPRLLVAGGWQHVVLAMPEGSAGTTLQEMMVQALPSVPITVLTSEEDISVCYEAAHLPWREMTAALVDHEIISAEVVERVLTRIDVNWSPAPVAASCE